MDSHPLSPLPPPDPAVERWTQASSRLRSLTAGVAFAGVAATAGIALGVSFAPGGSAQATDAPNAVDAPDGQPQTGAGGTLPQAAPDATVAPADPVAPDDSQQFGAQPFQPGFNDIQPPTRSGGRGHASTGGS
jgi:hypothetical protein